MTPYLERLVLRSKMRKIKDKNALTYIRHLRKVLNANTDVARRLMDRHNRLSETVHALCQTTWEVEIGGGGGK